MSINCDKEFKKYLDEIKITKTREENLKKSRDAIRNKIIDYFEEKEKKKPLFMSQGSFLMKTVINQSEGDYDLDDGIYLQNLEDKKEDWEKTETVHQWIKDAVDGHTNIPPEDKKNCVRVIYKRQNEEDSYHVDLPIYAEDENGNYYLARKYEDQWVESNSKDFSDWFKDKVKEEGEQFRKIIIYLKGWKDFKKYDISGIVFTLLVAKNFSSDERDDNCFFKTVKKICKYLEDNKTLNRPVSPKEDILDGWSDTKKDKLKEYFNSLKNNLQKIHDLKNKKEACEKYRDKIFGKRFPECEDCGNNETTSSYRTITNPTKPWIKF